MRVVRFLLISTLTFIIAPCAHALSYWDGAFNHPDTFLDPAYTAYNGVGQVSSAGGSCTGTAISARLILTASHCFDVGTNGTIDYTRGSFRYSVDGVHQGFQSGTVFSNPAYDDVRNPNGTLKYLVNDLAFIYLDSALPQAVNTYSLYSGPLDRRANDNSSATLVGFGLYYEEGVKVGEAGQRHVGTNQIDYYDANRKQVGILSENFTANIQPGDSGGPLFANYTDDLGFHSVIIGVASTGGPNAAGDFVGLGATGWYTYLGLMEEYIRDVSDDLGEELTFNRYFKAKNSNCPPGIFCKPEPDLLQPMDQFDVPEGLTVWDAPADANSVPEPGTLFCLLTALVIASRYSVGRSSRR